MFTSRKDKKGFQKNHRLSAHRGIKDQEYWPSSSSSSCTSTTSSSSSQRLSRDVYELANIPGSEVLSCRLRPNKCLPTILEEQCKIIDSDIIQGNRIVHWNTLEKAFNTCFNEHKRCSPTCDGWIRAVSTQERKWGLGFSVPFRCSEMCGYESRLYNLYEERESVVGSKGRKSAKMNLMLANALSKEGMGTSNIREIIAAVDVPPPSVSGLQKTLNHVCDDWIILDDEHCQETRTKINEIMKLRGQEGGIIAETDSCYNNPIKGRSFQQPGTQSFAAMLCEEPGLEGVCISMATCSKLCSCANDMHGPNCQRNFSLTEPMGNSEVKLAELNAKKILTNVQTPIRTLVTDNDSRVSAKVQSIMDSAGFSCDSQGCAWHITNSVKRGITNSSFSVQMIQGAETVKDRTQGKNVLARFLARRSSNELVVIVHSLKHQRKDENYLKKLQKRGADAICWYLRLYSWGFQKMYCIWEQLFLPQERKNSWYSSWPTRWQLYSTNPK